MPSPSALDPALTTVLKFLRARPNVRARLCAPKDKTVVYSGGVESVDGVFQAWRLLAQAKAQDPQRFDYITLEERLRDFHAMELGETLFEHANRVSDLLHKKGQERQSLILWRTLSGLYVQGATGRVRALILPTTEPGKLQRSVFNLTEVQILLRQNVLDNIDLDPALLREFRTVVRAGNTPAPIVVF
jgi:hypothetical protein